MICVVGLITRVINPKQKGVTMHNKIIEKFSKPAVTRFVR